MKAEGSSWKGIDISIIQKSSSINTGEYHAVYAMQGVGEVLEVFEDKLTITPEGIPGFMSKGLKGTKTIPFSSISAIQFKESGLMSGYLQFTIPGGNENEGGVFAAVFDENTFMFAGNNILAIEIKNYIESRIQSFKSSRVSSHNSMVEELTRLSELKEKGVLTEDEFKKAKQKLIS
ncbi:MAG: SHOCT domain-containing protein [Planctomycetes bacterium]|nr:SHOCT domain-containing protein [Planctomycetota bacterium]